MYDICVEGNKHRFRYILDWYRFGSIHVPYSSSIAEMPLCLEGFPCHFPRFSLGGTDSPAIFVDFQSSGSATAPSSSCPTMF